MSGLGRRVSLVTLLVVLLTVLATAGVAQRGTDGRNTADYFESVEGAKCFGCHSGQGFLPMDFRILTPYSQLPIDEPVDVELQIRHAGDMSQSLLDMAVTIDVAKASNVQVLVDDFVPETRTPVEAVLAHDAPVQERFEVGPGAITLEAWAEADSRGRPFDVGEELHVALVLPDGSRIDGTGPAMNKSLELGEPRLQEIGAGAFQLELRYTHPVPQLADEVESRAGVVVRYGQLQTSFRFEMPGGPIRGADPADELARTVRIPIVIRSEAEGLVDFRFEALNHWEHQPQDKATGDEGLYYRFATMKVQGGDVAVRASASSAPVSLEASVDLFTLFAKIIGFLTLLLVPVAMLTGGVFGKRSRRWLNRVTGGAKKRVLWHSAMSFMILGVATLHFVLALLEPGLKWSKGLFWGGVGWALLVSLGFTGWYQVRMIKRWNYRLWRHTHLWSAVAVLLFGVVHMLLDGADLQFVRDALPGWHERLVWP